MTTLGERGVPEVVSVEEMLAASRARSSDVDELSVWLLSTTGIDARGVLPVMFRFGFPHFFWDALALSPALPRELVNVLIGNPPTRRYAAWRRDLPPDVIRELAGDGNPSVRLAIASNPNAPPDVLARLAGDGNSMVRYAVAENPSTPPEVLASLLNDRDGLVRSAASKNPNATPRVYARALME